MELYPWLLAGIQVLMAIVYFALGRVVLMRRPEGEGRTAGTAFATWWFGLALLQAGGVVSSAITVTVGWTFPAFMTYFQAVLLDLVVILGALTYYFVYIFTGRRRSWLAVTGGYALYYGAILYYIAVAQPVGLVVEDGTTQLDYANDLSGTPFATIIGLLLLGPPLLGAVGYVSLFFKAPGRSQKFRIGAIGGAFLVWFGSSLLVSNFTDLAGTPLWRVLSSLIALGASFFVFIAFQPPDWIRRRFHVKGFGEGSTD